ncbi:TorF family putative porin [Brevundimonas staleyi]|uniref:TorF family putative porin n=1 Tax=Brevundimonas staleyi TaxID=74326 RepID=A0ABW0FSG7_9CAUL
MTSTARNREQNARSAKTLIAVGGLLAVLVPAAASAQDVNWTVGVASEYMGKGAGKSNGEIAPFGQVEVGFGQTYASVFASTAEISSGADAETIVQIGWRPTVGAVKLDLAILNRDLPGTRAGVDGNYFEYQADATHAFGPVTARFRVNYTPDGFAATREAWWIELQGSMALDNKTKASIALADRSADGGAEYVAWNAGVKRKLTDDVSLDLRWYDTDGHALGEPYEGRLVGALSFAF